MRWAQLGAVSPVMEVGGRGPNATPWALGPSAMRGAPRGGVLHYELFPYLLRPAAPRRAGAATARVRLPGRPRGLAGRARAARRPRPARGAGRRPGHDPERLPARRRLGRPLHRRRRCRAAPSFTRTTPLDGVPALRARRRRDPVQPAHGEGFVVGRRRADASRPRRATSRRTARRSSCAASRTTCRSSSRPPRPPGQVTIGGRVRALDVERRTRSRGVGDPRARPGREGKVCPRSPPRIHS